MTKRGPVLSAKTLQKMKAQAESVQAEVAGYREFKRVVEASVPEGLRRICLLYGALFINSPAVLSEIAIEHFPELAEFAKASEKAASLKRRRGKRKRKRKHP